MNSRGACASNRFHQNEPRNGFHDRYAVTQTNAKAVNARMPLPTVALKFKTGQGTISDIVIGRSWAGLVHD
jgi:hypothetical protein